MLTKWRFKTIKNYLRTVIRIKVTLKKMLHLQYFFSTQHFEFFGLDGNLVDNSQLM